MFSRIFIERPRFAMVISIVLTLAGVISVFSLPISLYPEITPPEVVVSATYPGASAEVIAKTVGIPLEEEAHLDLIEFKPSYVYIALESDAPIIPIYTNGKYGKDKKKDRTRLIIGEKIMIRELYDETKSEKENVDFINNFVKNRILELKNNLEEQVRSENG